MHNDTCSLIKQSYTFDSIGQQIPVESKTTVFCDVSSISRSEWFNAGQSGLKPEIMFTIFRGDYNGERIVEYDGHRYSVYRSYAPADSDNLELYAEAEVGS